MKAESEMSKIRDVQALGIDWGGGFEVERGAPMEKHDSTARTTGTDDVVWDETLSDMASFVPPPGAGDCSETEGMPLIDINMALRAINLLWEPGTVFEIRIQNAVRRGSSYVQAWISGYFDDPEKFIQSFGALRLKSAKGCFVTFNPIRRDLLARANNKFITAGKGMSTADKDIICRRWFVIDFDPIRPAGISATDAEKALAVQKIEPVVRYLCELGFPLPVIADSGNGYHLLYSIELPAADDTLERCLKALASKFDDAGVEVDTTLGTAGHLVKLYGTLAAKGDHCPELGRPHRMSRLISVPDPIVCVSAGSLKALAAQGSENRAGAPASSAPLARSGVGGKAWDKARVQTFIDTHMSNCRPAAAVPYDGGWMWVLEVCPFNHEHDNSSAVITLRDRGPGFKCHHNGCKENNWKALRTKFEPRSGIVTDVPCDNELIAQHGPMVILDEHGDPSGVNQLGLAARYARDNLILYEPTAENFYDYHADTGLWQTKTRARLTTDLGVALRDTINDYGCGGLLRCRTASMMGQILAFLQGIVEKRDAFQRRGDAIIHVGNGVCHLDTNPPTLKAFSPTYYSRNRTEYLYTPKATCPRFLNELLGVALDDKDISLLQRYAGQCLLGINKSQTILLIRGTAAGGKTTVVNIIEDIVGRNNVTQLRLQLMDSHFEIAGYIGKTLLSGKDVPSDFLDTTTAGYLKGLVGGDWFNVEEKNVTERQGMHGEFNVIVTSNSRLHVHMDSDSAAWRRRLLIIDYERPAVEKPIPNFDRQLLAAEGSGILNWCMAGAIQLLEELRDHGKIQLTAAQHQRVDALLSESDSVRRFVTDQVVRSDVTANITVAELHVAYVAFCDVQGWQAVTVRQFETQIPNVMMENHRAPKRTDIKRNYKCQRGFGGVALKTNVVV